jgi:hypothetical protein
MAWVWKIGPRLELEIRPNEALEDGAPGSALVSDGCEALEDGAPGSALVSDG